VSIQLSGSSNGARPKVLAQISDDKKEIIKGRQKLKKGFSHYIIKFASSNDNKEIGAIEYTYSLMAKNAGITISDTHLLKGKKGRYFAIKRFDRIGDKKVHMHSVAGLIHSDFRFPTLDYDDLLRLALHLTKSMAEVDKMFRLACFNLFAHNRDDHAKNFSFLMDEKGAWRVSPAYDITFSFGPGGEHSTMYLNEGKNPTKEHLKNLAKKYGIKKYDKIIDEVISGVVKFKSIANDVGVSKNTIFRINKIIMNNIK